MSLAWVNWGDKSLRGSDSSIDDANLVTSTVGNTSIRSSKTAEIPYKTAIYCLRKLKLSNTENWTTLLNLNKIKYFKPEYLKYEDYS